MKTILSLTALLLVAGMSFAQTDDAPAGEVPTNAEIIKLIENETNVGTLFQVVVGARGKQDYAVMEKAATRLVGLRPHVPDFAMLLARSYSLQNKITEALNLLLLLEREGVYFDLANETDLDNVRDSEAFRYIQHSFDVNNESVGTPLKAIALKRSDLLADSIAWDPNSETLLVGSVTEGAVYRVAADGSVEALIQADEENQLMSVFDLAVDAERDTLWVTSNAVAHFKGIGFSDNGRGGIWKFKLSTGEYLTRLETPRNGEFLLTDLVVSPTGTVFVANGKRPAILSVEPDGRELRRFISAADLTSIRALGISPDGSSLYFSDYELGVYKVDIAAQKTVAIVGLDTMNLGGVDDILVSEQYLMLIQNGGPPHRLMRLKVSSDGKVEAAQPLLSGLEEFQAPSTGVLVGKRLHMLSASHWNLYDAGSGQPRNGVTLGAPSILTADISFAPQAPERLFDPERALEKAKASRRD
jgi:hypothetical protein